MPVNLELFPNQEPAPPALRLCPICDTRVPADLLVCPVCVQQASDRAVRAYQYLPLRAIEAGDGYLIERLLRQERHLQMFGCEITFCGLEITQGRPRYWIRPDPQKLRGVCEKCREQVEAILAEALAR
jgi:hypothetical protein